MVKSEPHSDISVIPRCYGKARVVTAIFKKGSKDSSSYYRPMFLTSVTCKVIEHVIYRQVLNYLNQYNILVN